MVCCGIGEKVWNILDLARISCEQQRNAHFASSMDCRGGVAVEKVAYLGKGKLFQLLFRIQFGLPLSMAWVNEIYLGRRRTLLAQMYETRIFKTHETAVECKLKRNITWHQYGGSPGRRESSRLIEFKVRRFQLFTCPIPGGESPPWQVTSQVIIFFVKN